MKKHQSNHGEAVDSVEGRDSRASNIHGGIAFLGIYLPPTMVG